MFRGNAQHTGVYSATGVAKSQRIEMEIPYRRNGDWISGSFRQGWFTSGAQTETSMRWTRNRAIRNGSLM